MQSKWDRLEEREEKVRPKKREEEARVRNRGGRAFFTMLWAEQMDASGVFLNFKMCLPHWAISCFDFLWRLKHVALLLKLD